MNGNYQIPLAFLVLIAIAGMSPASGAITTIPPGGIVFMGEQGLDVTFAMDGDTQIGWWASAASIGDSAPTYFVSVSDPASLSISPAIFHSQTGSWYRLDPAGKANGTAFTVMDPTLELRVEDTTVNVDVTDKWVPTDDELRFRIDTNLVSIAQRPGITSVPITIKVRDPSGATYTSLINSAGTATSIVDIPVTSTPYYTAAIWDTGQRGTYAPGTYTMWAECNVNAMMDNYNYAGKTTSQKVTLQNQDHNPLITSNYPATTTAEIPPAVTTIPSPSVVPTTEVPASVVASPKETVPSTTVPVTTGAATPAPTHTPGFEGILAAIAVGLLAIASRQKD